MARSLMALIVDYLKLTAAATLLSVTQFALLPWLFYTFIIQKQWGIEEPADPSADPFAYYFSYCGMVLIAAFSIGVMVQLRIAKRNRLLPISSRVLSTWNWLSTIATVGVFNLLVQIAYWNIFQLQWPIATTTIALCTMAAVLVGTGQWLRDCRIHRLAIGMFFVGGSGYWLAQRLYGTDFSQPMQGWYLPTTLDLAIIAMISAAAWWMNHTGYTAYRSGTPVSGALLVCLTQQSLRGVNTPAERDLHEFKTPREAFLKMDWVRIRPISMGLYLGMQFGVGGLFWMLLRGNASSLNGIPVLYLVFSGVMGWLIGTIYAAATDAQSAGSVSPLASCLPLSDNDLGQLVTFSIVRFALLTWASMQLACLVVLLLSTPTILSDEFGPTFEGTRFFKQLGIVGVALLPLGSFFVSWAACGLGASVGLLAGRPFEKILATVFLTGCLLGVGIAFGVPYAQTVGYGLLIALALGGCGLGSFWLMMFARQNSLLSGRQLGAMASAALLISVATFAASPLDNYWKTVAAGFSVLTVVPFASIPSAVAFHRHR